MAAIDGTLYLKFTDEYVEINTSSLALSRKKLDEGVVQGGKASGLAITDDGRVYASFSAHGMGGPSGLTGLYEIMAEAGNPVARLLPVMGTLNYFDGKQRDDGTFLLLWGAEGHQLAVWRTGERDVSWVDVIGEERTD